MGFIFLSRSIPPTTTRDLFFFAVSSLKYFGARGECERPSITICMISHFAGRGKQACESRKQGSEEGSRNWGHEPDPHTRSIWVGKAWQGRSRKGKGGGGERTILGDIFGGGGRHGEEDEGKGKDVRVGGGGGVEGRVRKEGRRGRETNVYRGREESEVKQEEEWRGGKEEEDKRKMC